MTESLEDYCCRDCGVLVKNGKEECPACGKLLRAEPPRHRKRVGIDLDRVLIDEPERTYESRLEDGFSMLDWG
ncbi:MAG: hypothetical protein MUF23_17175 [Pirellula sp.]|nr:hypothetical protein [Pirellula sp.]